MSTLITSGSIIQGSIGPPGARNLEAVILRPDGDRFGLHHYWRSQVRPDQPWTRGALIAADATGPGVLCQRSDVGGVPGNFEVLVPEAEGLVHYWLDNAVTGPRPWHRVGAAAPGSTGPGAILENRVNGNLEVVALHGTDLDHHWFDRTAWRRGGRVTERASGPPAMIQSDYGDHIEVVVPEGPDLVLYWLDGFGPGASWRPGGTITRAGDGPVGFVQGRYGAPPNHNFEVVVPRGDTLAVYWRENTKTSKPWRQGGLAAWGAGAIRAASLISSDLGDGWLQVLTQEATSIYHLYRHPVGTDFRWMRSSCIRLDDTQPADVDWNHPRSEKVAQISGEPDAETGAATLSSSWTRSRIRGTDLGVRVEHLGRTFLLFGDTHWEDGNRVTLDAIAEVRRPSADKPDVLMHGAPLEIVGGPATQREYDVPLDAFSAADNLFVFFTSDHFADGKVMGRSVLTRALDAAVPIDGGAVDRPLRFQLLTTFSDYRFINASVQLLPAVAVPGFGRDGWLLLVWGSGAYRADDLRLAVLDLRDPAAWSRLFDDEPFSVTSLPIVYFTGMCGAAPLWSRHEDEARPVLWPLALGELSVRWVPELDRYVMLAMSGVDDPIGASVWLRTAPNPWGTWSRRRQVFDWIQDGLGFRPGSRQFVQRPGVPPGPPGDCVFDLQCNSGGAGYAPYLYDVHVRGGNVLLRYTLSTWNPYQSILMRHRATVSELDALAV